MAVAGDEVEVLEEEEVEEHKEEARGAELMQLVSHLLVSLLIFAHEHSLFHGAWEGDNGYQARA